MAAAYHHGTETIRIDGGSNPVYTVDGAITAIIGTAPVGAVNELTVCQTKKDFGQFGGELTAQGFTLPDAAHIWTRYGSGVAYVVNVCDPAKHKTSVSNEVLTVDPDTLTAKTAKPALQSGYTLTDGGNTLTENTHYTINTLTGEITYKTKPNSPKISYTYTDPTKVPADDIIGAYVAATGKRTGLELLTEGFNRQGADAKIIIAPDFDRHANVRAAMEVIAGKLKAIAYVAAPQGTSLSKALEGRGPLGTINFQTSSDRCQLFYPHVVGLLGLENLATHAAGLRMKTDVEQGYWFSISNRELLGVTGVEIGLTARADDPQSETNRLNEKGITTVFNSYGTGYRMWGNRLACFPTTSHIKNFEVAQRTGDIIDESIRRLELQYVDKPIDADDPNALIDSLLESVRTYMSTLKSIVGFSVDLDYEYDLVDAFSKGQVPIVYDYTPKLPAERITNTSVMTRKYLVNLLSAN